MTAFWTAEELNQYVEQGYNDLAIRTGCLWATAVSPDIPFAFCITADFEFDLMTTGEEISPAAQFTSEFERDWVNNARGPANHNHRFEYVDGHVVDIGMTTEISAIVDLPDELYAIERATWNTIRLGAERSRSFEVDDTRYELTKGEVQAFVQDKDGLRRLRKWRVPSVAYSPYELDTGSSEFGILVDVSEIDADVPQGETWGDFVRVAGEEMIGDPFGVIVAIYKEPNAMRYEYRRRGGSFDSASFENDLEIPVRYQVYTWHYAQARALEREGDGQDLELSAWYQSRYEAGVNRMLQRKKYMAFQRKYVMGGGKKQESRLPLAHLPFHYGKVIR